MSSENITSGKDKLEEKNRKESTRQTDILEVKKGSKETAGNTGRTHDDEIKRSFHICKFSAG